MSETPMAGGWQTDVTRDGDIVRRSAKPQSATVIALLRVLAAVGFDAAPRPIGSSSRRSRGSTRNYTTTMSARSTTSPVPQTALASWP